MGNVVNLIEKYLNKEKEGYIIHKIDSLSKNSNIDKEYTDFITFYGINDIKSYKIIYKYTDDGYVDDDMQWHPLYNKEIINIKKINKTVNSGKKIKATDINIYENGKKDKNKILYILVYYNNNVVWSAFNEYDRDNRPWATIGN